MGTIVERRRKNGTIAYMAKIVLKREGQIIHRETQTFDRRAVAVAWTAKRELELERPGEIERSKTRGVTLADAIDRYTREAGSIGRTKAQVLQAIKRHPIAGLECHAITSDAIGSFARDLLATRQPQTVGNYLSHLGAIFAIARPAWGYALNDRAHADAFHVARRLGIVSKSRMRDRRPTLDEMSAVMAQLAERRQIGRGFIPMGNIVLFSLFSTRRLAEVTRITWADLEPQHGRVLVRDMKHPGQKAGNHIWCDLTPEALAVIQSMPRDDERIFPFDERSISASFTRLCKFLEIEDLHLHDLRHEGISRLFEMGWNIPRVASVSGHRSWQSLKRYTHMRETGDKYAGWQWLPRREEAARLPRRL